MTERTILVVKNSWSLLVPRAEEVGARFYQKLFELDPTLRPLFKSDLESQTKKLMTMLTVVISKLQSLSDIIGQVNALAQRHVHYGARPAHYQTVGQALLWTLEQNLGHRWDPETRQAWTDVYTLLANAMIAAAATAPQKTPVSEAA
ncbi:MAG: hemin receptor [Sphingobacteriaceae bacterium]|nr:hemin receptor [Cytophagaceae bacterium]